MKISFKKVEEVIFIVDTTEEMKIFVEGDEYPVITYPPQEHVLGILIDGVAYKIERSMELTNIINKQLNNG